MKASGAPETGDLVVVRDVIDLDGDGTMRTSVIGLVTNTIGIQCEVQWPPEYAVDIPEWLPRTELEVVGDVNECR